MIPASVVALMQGALARTPGIAGALGAAWRPKRRIHPFQAPPFLEEEGWVQGLALLVPLA